MDRSWLERELRSARSIESIAREVGRAPSTVSYWVAKHGLVSSHAAKHAARGGIAREELEPLVAAGLSMRAMGVAALQFHHLDRAQKAFELSHGGVARALEAARAEAVKCVLLCANCHAEVEVGAASVR